MSAFRLSLATTVATFVLLVVGGTVNPSGSSLACPDWPTCYGSFFPEMTGGVQFEHTHRVVASLVGLMTCILGGVLWFRRRDDRRLRALGLLAVAAVIVQGVLGGVTVLLRLPTAVSVAHLALSMLFFTLVIYLSFRTYPGSRAAAADPPPAAPRRKGPARSLAVAAYVAIYVQLLLGALVRHTGAGGVCGTEIPRCAAAWWPALGPQQLHMLHRYAGIAVFAIIIVASISAAAEARLNRRRVARVAALAAPYLALLQVWLGIETVRSGIGLIVVTAHLAGGAALLATFAAIVFDLGISRGAVQRDVDVDLGAGLPAADGAAR